MFKPRNVIWYLKRNFSFVKIPKTELGVFSLFNKKFNHTLTPKAQISLVLPPKKLLNKP